MVGSDNGSKVAHETAHMKIPGNDILLAAYQEATGNAKWIVDKIWTNARFFATLTSALITLTVVIIVSLVKDKPVGVASPFVLLLAILPVIVITLSFLGIANLRREYSRFLDWIAIMSKLQEKLGLCQAMKFDVFPKDKYLLPRRFVEHQFDSSDDFHAAGMSKRDSVFLYFSLVHWIYVSMSIFGIAVIVALYLIG